MAYNVYVKFQNQEFSIKLFMIWYTLLTLVHVYCEYKSVHCCKSIDVPQTTLNNQKKIILHVVKCLLNLKNIYDKNYMFQWDLYLLRPLLLLVQWGTYGKI